MNGSSDVKVLYIAGWGRSGSTILTNLLGQVPGFFSGGELRYLWERNLAGGHECGCGEAFLDCKIWSRVGSVTTEIASRIPSSTREGFGLSKAIFELQTGKRA